MKPRDEDSGRRLRAAYAKVREKAGVSPARKAKGHDAAAVEAGASADAQAIMALMIAGFAKLKKSLEKLARARATA